MSGSILDTNVLIDLFRKDQATIDKIRGLSKIYVPAIVLGELYYGANLSNQKKRRILEVEELSNDVVVLDCNQITAAIYGKIKAELKEKGRRIPENDIWIAAIAVQHDLVLITNDKHFSYVPDLSVEKMQRTHLNTNNLPRPHPLLPWAC